MAFIQQSWLPCQLKDGRSFQYWQLPQWVIRIITEWEYKYLLFARSHWVGSKANHFKSLKLHYCICSCLTSSSLNEALWVHSKCKINPDLFPGWGQYWLLPRTHSQRHYRAQEQDQGEEWRFWWPDHPDSGHTLYILCAHTLNILLFDNVFVLSQVGNYFWPRISKIYFKGIYFMLRVRDKTVSIYSENQFQLAWRSYSPPRHDQLDNLHFNEAGSIPSLLKYLRISEWREHLRVPDSEQESL